MFAGALSLFRFDICSCKSFRLRGAMKRTARSTWRVLENDVRGTRCFVEGDMQCRQATQAEVLAPLGRVAGIERQIARMPRDGFKRQLTFDSRQRGAETKVTGPTKSQMSIVGASDVQSIGIGEPFRIAVAGTHNRNHSLTLANQLALEPGVFGTDARRVLAGTFITK